MSDTGENDATAGLVVQMKAADGSMQTLSGEMRVGRSKDCEICIEDSHVSRSHALISVMGERVTIEDLGSVNGTRVNGLRIDAGVELRDGDTVMFDNHLFKVVIVGTPEPIPEPTPEPIPEPIPEPTPEPAPAVPGSWVESGIREHTQILPVAKLDIPENKGAIERKSELPHLLVLSDDGGHELLELEISPSDNQDIWEIGRGESCEIQVSDPSVSVRHAQLIHKDGRWRLVNLVSANGLFVNDEKRLTAYLSDGDEIRLGRIKVVFRTSAGASITKRPGLAATTGEEGQGISKPILVAAVFVAVIALVLWKML